MAIKLLFPALILFGILLPARSQSPEQSLLREEIFDDTNFSYGWSILNIGYLGNMGSSRDYLSADLCFKPGVYLSYHRLYTFLEVKFGDLSKLRMDYPASPMLQGMRTYHQLTELALGYDILADHRRIIPYIGYSWQYMRVENEDENIMDFHSRSVSFNVSFVSMNLPMSSKRIFKGRVDADRYATSYLTLGLMPFNYDEVFKGSYIYFNLGLYFNRKFRKVDGAI